METAHRRALTAKRTQIPEPCWSEWTANRSSKEMFEAITAAHPRGVSKRAIARKFGRTPLTIRRYLQGQEVPGTCTTGAAVGTRFVPDVSRETMAEAVTTSHPQIANVEDLAQRFRQLVAGIQRGLRSSRRPYNSIGTRCTGRRTRASSQASKTAGVQRQRVFVAAPPGITLQNRQLSALSAAAKS